jgi:hypothetical protein
MNIYIKLICFLLGHNWRLAVITKINKIVKVCTRCGEIQ